MIGGHVWFSLHRKMDEVRFYQTNDGWVVIAMELMDELSWQWSIIICFLLFLLCIYTFSNILVNTNNSNIILFVSVNICSVCLYIYCFYIQLHVCKVVSYLHMCSCTFVYFCCICTCVNLCFIRASVSISVLFVYVHISSCFCMCIC